MKIITEVNNSIGPKIDVTKNYSRLPKSMNYPQPNDSGQPVYPALFKKSSKTGTFKGGLK